MRTACPYCGVGCGVLGTANADTQGDPVHPANFGKLCSKGGALHETIGMEGRLLTPHIGGVEASWARAIDEVARNFRASIDEYGPDSVAFYVSGQLLTEDYYLANKLMKGFIGSGNIDTNSRLCMASAVAAHNLAFGEDVVPGTYQDLELADLIVFAGHNAAWTHPILHRRMENQQARGQIHIVIDPRHTDTAVTADLHLAIKPQTDIRLWKGLAAYLFERNGVDQVYVAAHTSGLKSLIAALAEDDQSIGSIANDCGLDTHDVARFYQTFLQTPKTVTLFSQGLNQSAQGVDNGLAVINAHLLTGRVSKPGASPFSITGQPNAMGGRETGGMATTLAAHLGFSEADRAIAARFWDAPQTACAPGLKAVDMFEAVATGKIKALWVMATNPALSLPDSNVVEMALKRCAFLALSEVTANTETARYADVVMPALAWGEKDGTVTNSERTITRQRAFLPRPGKARADWEIIAAVARAMGYTKGFTHKNSSEVFAEFAAMTNFENSGKRALQLGPLADLSLDQYKDLAPIKWPITSSGNSIERPFADGHFNYPDGKARLIGVKCQGPARTVSAHFPLALNTGRLRDQWHTMTRTGQSSRLMRHAPEPVVDMHPIDAQREGILDGGLAQVETAFGTAVLRARVSAKQRRGDLFVPMHFSDSFAPLARANRLTNSDRDAKSGQPEFKHTPAAIAPIAQKWRGFLAAQDRLDPNQDIWWARTPEAKGNLYELTGLPNSPDLTTYVTGLKTHFQNCDVIETGDSAGTFARIAFLVDDRLVAVFAGGVTKGLPQRDWLLEQLGQAPDDQTRIQLLVGGAPVAGAASNRDAVICACFGITLPQIKAFASVNPGSDVRAIGQALKAGTNCGSCRGEILTALKSMAAQDEGVRDDAKV